MRQNLKVQSGNRIAVVFDGKEIGMVQSVNINDSYGLEAASGIGDIHVQEHVPTMAVHSLSVSTLLLKKGAMMQAGIIPENGEFALQGLVFDFEVYSKDDGALLRKYVGCSYDSGGMDVSKHAIVVQNGQFKALDVVGVSA